MSKGTPGPGRLARFSHWLRSQPLRLRHLGRKPPKAATNLPASRVLHGLYLAAVLMIVILVVAASAASFAESYRGLYEWAHGHGLKGFWADVWPLQVDVFIAVGELALFIALVARWRAFSRWPAWTVTIIGLAVSVAGNIGHVHSHAVTTRATAAVPPLAAAFALAVGLGVLKRIVAAMATKDAPGTVSAPSFTDAQTAAAEALARTYAAGNPLTQNKLMTQFRLNRLEAQEVRQRVLPQTPNGSSPEAPAETDSEH